MQHFTVVIALFLPLAWASPYFQSKCINFTIGQIVETSSGPVAGHAAPNYSEVSEYLGIPYAQAPVGDLRFAAPVKYTGSLLVNGSVFVGHKVISSHILGLTSLRDFHVLDYHPNRRPRSQLLNSQHQILPWSDLNYLMS